MAARDRLAAAARDHAGLVAEDDRPAVGSRADGGGVGDRASGRGRVGVDRGDVGRSRRRGGVGEDDVLGAARQADGGDDRLGRGVDGAQVAGVVVRHVEGLSVEGEPLRVGADCDRAGGGGAGGGCRRGVGVGGDGRVAEVGDIERRADDLQGGGEAGRARGDGVLPGGPARGGEEVGLDVDGAHRARAVVGDEQVAGVVRHHRVERVRAHCLPAVEGGRTSGGAQVDCEHVAGAARALAGGVGGGGGVRVEDERVGLARADRGAGVGAGQVVEVERRGDGPVLWARRGGVDHPDRPAVAAEGAADPVAEDIDVGRVTAEEAHPWDAVATGERDLGDDGVGGGRDGVDGRVGPHPHRRAVRGDGDRLRRGREGDRGADQRVVRGRDDIDARAVADLVDERAVRGDGDELARGCRAAAGDCARVDLGGEGVGGGVEDVEGAGVGNKTSTERWRWSDSDRLDSAGRRANAKVAVIARVGDAPAIGACRMKNDSG